MLAGGGIDGVGVDEGAERATVDDEPRDKGAELGGREDVYLEHRHRVWADGDVPESVDAQFGNCGGWEC